jgi:hypothetical protein
MSVRSPFGRRSGKRLDETLETIETGTLYEDATVGGEFRADGGDQVVHIGVPARAIAKAAHRKRCERADGEQALDTVQSRIAARLAVCLIGMAAEFTHIAHDEAAPTAH